MLLGLHRRAWIALLAIACAVTPGLVARGLMWMSRDAVLADVPAITPQVDPTIRPPQPVTTSATAIVESELTTGVMLLRTHDIVSEVFTCRSFDRRGTAMAGMKHCRCNS